MESADSQNLDIKHIIEQLSKGVNFIDIPEKPVTGDDWLRKSIIINDTFIDLSRSNSLVLMKNYDGLFLIDKITVPQK